MRARAELLVLAVAAVAIAAFIASFALGLRRPPIDDGTPAHAPERAPVAPTVAPALGRVEVLNASRRAGAARAATERLRSGEYDVVYFGNAPGSPADSSIVIDRVGRPDVARGAAARLGIARTTTQIDTTLYVDATVILGTDWGGAVPRGEGVERPDSRTHEGWRERIGRWLRR